jgi:raffinose/stachyose/melibiose transport system permease protein
VDRGVNLARHITLICLSAIIILPLFTVVMGGFKTLGDLAANPVGFPAVWSMDAYRSILADPRFATYLANSLVISCAAVATTVLLASMGAFAVVYLLGRYGSHVMRAYGFGLMVPPAIAVLPIFLQMRDLGLLDTHIGVIIPQVAFGLAVATFLFQQFFREIPDELFQSAQIDGCGYLRFYFQIVLPLSKPILATVATIQFVLSWNNYILPLLILSTESAYTWPMGLMAYQGENLQEWNLVLAFVALTLVPSILFFILCQRYIVAGLSSGAVKG